MTFVSLRGKCLGLEGDNDQVQLNLWEFRLFLQGACYQLLCNNLAISCLHFKGFFFALFLWWRNLKWSSLDFELAYHSTHKRILSLPRLGNEIFFESFFVFSNNAKDYCKQMRKNVYIYTCAYKTFSMEILCYLNFVTTVCCSLEKKRRDLYLGFFHCLINFALDFPT